MLAYKKQVLPSLIDTNEIISDDLNKKFSKYVKAETQKGV